MRRRSISPQTPSRRALLLRRALNALDVESDGRFSRQLRGETLVDEVDDENAPPVSSPRGENASPDEGGDPFNANRDEGEDRIVWHQIIDGESPASARRDDQERTHLELLGQNDATFHSDDEFQHRHRPNAFNGPVEQNVKKKTLTKAQKSCRNSCVSLKSYVQNSIFSSFEIQKNRLLGFHSRL